ncbi:CFI-box-CTERM domain-containing protein [Roseateles sp. P5_E8]
MSDRNLPAPSEGSRRSPTLHDNGLRAGNLIDTAISRLDDEQVRALGVKAGEAALELQKRQAQHNIDYVAGRKVVEDHIDTWDALNKQGKTTRQSVTTDVNVGAGRMSIESKSGATCFVATAAYGDWRHPDVEYLRWFRDNVLIESFFGRAFTKTYWIVGPQFAKLVAPFPAVRAAARGVLGALVRSLRNRYGDH